MYAKLHKANLGAIASKAPYRGCRIRHLLKQQYPEFGQFYPKFTFHNQPNKFVGIIIMQLVKFTI